MPGKAISRGEIRRRGIGHDGRAIRRERRVNARGDKSYSRIARARARYRLRTTIYDRATDDDGEARRRRGLRVATPIVFGFHFAQVCVIINPEMEVNVERVPNALVYSLAPPPRFFRFAVDRRLALSSFSCTRQKRGVARTTTLRERFRGLNY